MKARVTVTLKSGVLDPQGKAIESALRSLGVTGVASVRQGKVFEIEIAGLKTVRDRLDSSFDRAVSLVIHSLRQRGKIVLGKRHVGRTGAIPQCFATLEARDWHNALTLRQQPGKRDLRV